MARSPTHAIKKARLIRPGLFGNYDEAGGLGNTTLDQTIGTTFGNATFEQTIGATFGNATFEQTIGATFGNAAFEQTIRTTFGNATFDQTIGATFGNAAFEQTIGAAFGNAAFEQTIRTALSNTTFNQLVRAAFSDLGVCRGGGKSVNGENRESDAEKGLAFHDRVLQGVVVCLEPMLRRGFFMRTSLP
jgi:hypothetical protein